jgi:hypothetical protein|tara:strand:- start:9659 stop:10291 length:633 start_codon:yes stop_codon:yes gene_type:complete
MKDVGLTVLENMPAGIEKELLKVTDKHKKVSDMTTPPSQISKKMGLDYVEIGYMKHIADTEFPGWSWEIIKSEALGSEAYVVHGRLTYFSAGIRRSGDMVAAHRIQKGRESGTFVDVGNDIKSANTDCMKKAFNMYMNIADDVYRNQVVDLDENDKMMINEKMLKAGFDSKEIARIGLNITKGKVNQLNVDDLYKWIDEQSKPKKESTGK